MVLHKGFMMIWIEFIVILVLCCTSVAVGYPSRPLNERSPELTWQAWILVDDQNQHQNGRHSSADGMLRRRITPKSVFIAPTFSPESLPPCASGYSSDQMGRCIKIIELNNTVHEEFILELLKNKFSTDYDYDDSETEKPPNGPLQVNIPLDYGDNIRDSEDDDDSDIAIIVSPTRPDFDFKKFNLDKRDSPSDEAQQEFFLKRLGETSTKKAIEVLTKKIGETATENIEDVTATEHNIVSTIQIEPTTSTTTEQPIETTTNTPSTSEIITSTEKISTLPFEPNLTVMDDSSTTISTTTTVEDIQTTSMPTTGFPTISTDVTTQTEKIVTFAPSDVPIAFPESSPTSYVKFPEETSIPTQIPSSIELVTNFRVSLPLKQAQSDDPIVFREDHRNDPNRELNLEIANLDYSNGFQLELTTEPPFNRRNRDRNSMFSFPDRWRDSHFQKPLVLRFSRKHAYFDSDQLNHPEYYRAIPSSDFAYLFKFKHKPNRR